MLCTVTLPMVPHNQSPTIGPLDQVQQPWVVPPDHTQLPHWVQEDHLQHLASPQLVPPSHGQFPTAGPFTGMAASIAKHT